MFLNSNSMKSEKTKCERTFINGNINSKGYKNANSNINKSVLNQSSFLSSFEPWSLSYENILVQISSNMFYKNIQSIKYLFNIIKYFIYIIMPTILFLPHIFFKNIFSINKFLNLFLCKKYFSCLPSFFKKSIFSFFYIFYYFLFFITVSNLLQFGKFLFFLFSTKKKFA